VAKALAERYRSIIPEEKERLEGLAKVDKERFVLYFYFTIHSVPYFHYRREYFTVVHLEEVSPARTYMEVKLTDTN
jgi:hypothetical protein